MSVRSTLKNDEVKISLQGLLGFANSLEESLDNFCSLWCSSGNNSIPSNMPLLRNAVEKYKQYSREVNLAKQSEKKSAQEKQASESTASKLKQEELAQRLRRMEKVQTRKDELAAPRSTNKIIGIKREKEHIQGKSVANKDNDAVQKETTNIYSAKAKETEQSRESGEIGSVGDGHHLKKCQLKFGDNLKKEGSNVQTIMASNSSNDVTISRSGLFNMVACLEETLDNFFAMCFSTSYEERVKVPASMTLVHAAMVKYLIETNDTSILDSTQSSDMSDVEVLNPIDFKPKSTSSRIGINRRFTERVLSQERPSVKNDDSVLTALETSIGKENETDLNESTETAILNDSVATAIETPHFISTASIELRAAQLSQNAPVLKDVLNDSTNTAILDESTHTAILNESTATAIEGDFESPKNAAENHAPKIKKAVIPMSPEYRDWLKKEGFRVWTYRLDAIKKAPTDEQDQLVANLLAELDAFEAASR